MCIRDRNIDNIHIDCLVSKNVYNIFMQKYKYITFIEKNKNRIYNQLIHCKLIIKNDYWIIGGGGLFPTENIKALFVYTLDVYKRQPLYNIPKIVTNATGCYMLIPKEVLVEVGYMAEDYFLYYEDTDYVIRVMRAGYNILYCPESIIYHKVLSLIHI